MKNLEKLVNQNRAAFDDAEPSSEHFARFREKLESSEKRRPVFLSNKIQRYAAVLIMAVAVTGALTVSIYLKNQHQASQPIPPELSETEKYYQQQIDHNIEIIKTMKIAGDGTDKRNIMDEIHDMKSSIKQLKKDLVKYQYDERVEHAIITQYQMELELTHQIINKTKKWNS
jgi:hypothetical protein